jgi:hypothetical protein
VDRALSELDAEGEPLTKLSDDSPVRSGIATLAERLGL